MNQTLNHLFQKWVVAIPMGLALAFAAAHAAPVTGFTYKDSTRTADTLAFRRDVPVTVTPTYNGGPVDSFAIVGFTTTLPTGLTFDKATGVISGTPTALFAAGNRTIRAYASAGVDSTTRTVRISCVLVTSLAYRDSTKPADTLILRRNVPVIFTPTYFGGTLDSFKVVSTFGGGGGGAGAVNLPDGITLNPLTGVLSGTPTGTFPVANRSIRGYGSAGTDSITRTIRIASVLVTSLAYVDSTKPADTLNFTTGIAVNLTPTYLGGTLDSFKVVATGGGGGGGGAVNLPAGVTLNPTTGVISGTPTAAFAAANRSIRGYGSAGTDSVTRTVRFTVVLGQTQNLGYTRDTVTLAVGVPSTNAPVFTGRAPTAYTISPSLPAGLTLNGTTGVISGKPTATSSVTNYTVKAYDLADSLTKVVRINVVPSEGYSNWAHNATIWLNTAPAAGGVAITANVTKIPVLIRLDATNFGTGFSEVAPQQSDLRFTREPGSSIRYHEVERWDSAAQVADIWVLMDTVYAGNATQSIRMYWGKSGVLNASSGASVFDTAYGDRAVYHFTGTSNVVNETDATANAFVASNLSTVDIQNPGVIGRGRDFNGTNEHFRVQANPAGAVNFAANGNYTVSAWASANVNQDDRIILSKGGMAYTLKVNATGSWEFSEYNNNAGSVSGGDTAAPWALQSAVDSQIASTTDWQYVVGVSSGNTKRLYVNGVLAATNTGTALSNYGTPSATARVNTDTLTLGRQAEAAAGFWGGDLDEVRLAGVARSADYIKLSYANQKTAGNLVSFTLPVSIRQIASASASKAVQSLGYKTMGRGILFQIQGGAATSFARAQFTLMDMQGRSVWTRNVSGGSQQIQWDGMTRSGSRAPSGLYVARIVLLDGNDRVQNVLETKLPLTR
jgi:hypothetical protein